jgi:hypothetical protein
MRQYHHAIEDINPVHPHGLSAPILGVHYRPAVPYRS